MDRLRLGKSKPACLKLIRFHLILMDRVYQPIVIADRQKVDAEALLSLDIGISMRMLIQISHYRKESGLIAVKAAPCMKTDIWLSIIFPSGDRKQD